MKGHLLRCRCASGAHVRTQYVPLRCSFRLASGPSWTGSAVQTPGPLL